MFYNKPIISNGGKKMKTLIVYNHPYEGSFCHAILESTIQGAKEARHEVDVINLDYENFNPVMTGKDLLGFIKHEMVDEQSKEYSRKIQQSDNLVLIFPIWWELMPAMIKGFIDKVVFPGSFYDYTASGYGMISKLPNLKKVTIITTMNTPKLVYRFIYGNALKNALVKGTFKKAGVKNVEWISFNMVKQSSDKQRTNWLRKARNLF